MNTMEDWEQWARLYRENPEAFERERQAAIEELIMNQPVDVRHRSRQLQWRIDAVRRRAPNSLASCIRIYDMLMDSVYGPGGLLEILTGNIGTGDVVRSRPRGEKGICLKLRRPDRKQPDSVS